MKAILFPIGSVLFYFLLLNSFPWGERGSGLVIFITMPIIIFISLIISLIFYLLEKKGKKTKLFSQISVLFLVVVCYYYYFPSDKSPISTISDMINVRKNYSNIKIEDYFLDDNLNDNPENYSKIVAAKKKFYNSISEKSYSIFVDNYYDYKIKYLNLGVILNNKKTNFY